MTSPAIRFRSTWQRSAESPARTFLTRTLGSAFVRLASVEAGARETAEGFFFSGPSTHEGYLATNPGGTYPPTPKEKLHAYFWIATVSIAVARRSDMYVSCTYVTQRQDLKRGVCARNLVRCTGHGLCPAKAGQNSI